MAKYEVRGRGSREDIVEALQEAATAYIDSQEEHWRKAMDMMEIADRKSFMQGVDIGVGILMTDIWKGRVGIKSNFT